MAETIENGGRGVKIGTHVDENEQLHVLSVSKTIIQDSTTKGQSYNINTGIISLTSTTKSAVLYFKNNEAPFNGDTDFVIDAVVIGIDNLGTTSGMARIEVITNPTTGTIITNAVAVESSVNRNFGSSNALDSLKYKGVEGDTFTNGTKFGDFFQSQGSRGFYSLDLVLPKGSSLGINVDTQTTAGTTAIYVALIGHRIDGKNV